LLNESGERSGVERETGITMGPGLFAREKVVLCVCDVSEWEWGVGGRLCAGFTGRDWARISCGRCTLDVVVVVVQVVVFDSMSSTSIPSPPKYTTCIASVTLVFPPSAARCAPHRATAASVLGHMLPITLELSRTCRNNSGPVCFGDEERRRKGCGDEAALCVLWC
jgi:hypothetical protein